MYFFGYHFFVIDFTKFLLCSSFLSYHQSFTNLSFSDLQSDSSFKSSKLKFKSAFILLQLISVTMSSNFLVILLFKSSSFDISLKSLQPINYSSIFFLTSLIKLLASYIPLASSTGAFKFWCYTSFLFMVNSYFSIWFNFSKAHAFSISDWDDFNLYSSLLM